MRKVLSGWHLNAPHEVISGDWRSHSRHVGSTTPPTNRISVPPWRVTSCIGLILHMSVWSCVYCVAECNIFLHKHTFIFKIYFGNCPLCLSGCAWFACGCDWEYLLSPLYWVKGTYLVSGKPQSYIYDLTEDWNAVNNYSTGSLQSPCQPSLSRCGGRGTHSKDISQLSCVPVQKNQIINLRIKSYPHKLRVVNSCKLNKRQSHVAVVPIVQP